ncbi:MAG: peptidylprolyl isomerase [Bacteroidota bacterium]
MKSIIFTLAVLFAFAGCNSPKTGNPHVEIQTQYGDIELELYPAQASKSVAAFLSYVDSGWYQKSSFYRALNRENQPTGAAEAALIQGGTWAGNDRPQVPGIPHETTKQTGLFHKDGTLSLARKEPGSASTEFFICIDDQPGFDYGGDNNGDGQGYAAFGKVVKGMDVVRRIHRQPVNGELFEPKIFIRDIVRL